MGQQLREAAARCLTVLQRYHDGERTATTKEIMGLEVGLVAAWLLGLRLPPGVTEGGVLAPVEEELLARYGHEAGRKLNAEFVEAFETQGMDLLSRFQGSERWAVSASGGRSAG